MSAEGERMSQNTWSHSSTPPLPLLFSPLLCQKLVRAGFPMVQLVLGVTLQNSFCNDLQSSSYTEYSIDRLIANQLSCKQFPLKSILIRLLLSTSKANNGEHWHSLDCYNYVN